MATTKHTCGGPKFGRKDPSCPRCKELLAGAPAVQWRISSRAASEAQLLADIRNHDCRASRCGPVCTYGQW